MAENGSATAMKLIFGATWVLIITAVNASNRCGRLCCLSLNMTVAQNATSLPTTTKTSDTLRCMQKCQGLHRVSDINHISVKELCAKQNQENISINSSTLKEKELSCGQMAEEACSTFVGLVKGVNVTFNKVTGNNTYYYYVNVTWNPFHASKPSQNWSHYVVIWRTERSKLGDHRCNLVPKDQPFFLINSSKYWNYPWAIELNISTYPLKKDAGYRLRIFAKPKIKIFFKKSPFHEETKGFSSGLLAAIIVGSCVGFALFIFVLVAWKLRSGDIFWTYFGNLETSRKKEISKMNKEMKVIENTSQVYLSYFNEDDQYLATVVSIYHDLSVLGYTVKFNKTSIELIEEGTDRWAHEQITNSFKIIVLCSPSYIKICQKGGTAVACTSSHNSCEWNRVWFEIESIGNVYKERKSASKIVCIWMNVEVPDGLPPWMAERYTWRQDFKKIERRLKNNSTGSRKSTSKESKPSTSCDISSYDNDANEVFT